MNYKEYVRHCTKWNKALKKLAKQSEKIEVMQKELLEEGIAKGFYAEAGLSAGDAMRDMMINTLSKIDYKQSKEHLKNRINDEKTKIKTLQRKIRVKQKKIKDCITI